jgi:hypothetical protein
MHGNMNINYNVVKFIPHIFIIVGAFHFLKKGSRIVSSVHCPCVACVISCNSIGCHFLLQTTGCLSLATEYRL